MESIELRMAEESDLAKIFFYLKKFKLDYEDINPDQFVIAEINGKLAGFGRIKPYEKICELSSIGVIEEFRKQGVGEKLIKYLIDIFPLDEVWITTIIPEYFVKFGFEYNLNPPDEIKQKCQRICSIFNASPEDSHFMMLKKDL